MLHRNGGVEMGNFVMDVIPEPKAGTASVLILDKKGRYSIIKGQGNDNYLCGTCGNVICENIDRGQVAVIVFKCPNCDSFNLIKGT